MIKALSDLGIRPDHAYTAGLFSVGLSFGGWFLSRFAKAESKPQADRWGIFVGHWAPTFFGLGLALAEVEKRNQKKK